MLRNIHTSKHEATSYYTKMSKLATKGKTRMITCSIRYASVVSTKKRKQSVAKPNIHLNHQQHQGLQFI
jgi:hypothetical protein